MSRAPYVGPPSKGAGRTEDIERAIAGRCSPAYVMALIGRYYRLVPRKRVAFDKDYSVPRREETE